MDRPLSQAAVVTRAGAADPAHDDLPALALAGPDGRLRLTMDVAFRAARAEGDTAVVEGIAYPALVVGADNVIDPAEVGRIDTYRTWMAPETLRRFAHTMLERGTGGVDSQHDHENVGCIVESWYQREASSTYPADVWVAVVRVLRAATVKAVLDGTLTGFSIEFTGKYRERVLTIGTKKVRTAEIVNPYPLTLSVVDRPAIRVPFALVEARSAGGEGGEGGEGGAGGSASARASQPAVGGCACQHAHAEAAQRRELLLRCSPDGLCPTDEGAPTGPPHEATTSQREAAVASPTAQTKTAAGAAGKKVTMDVQSSTPTPTPAADPASIASQEPAARAADPAATTTEPAAPAVPATEAATPATPATDPAAPAQRASRDPSKDAAQFRAQMRELIEGAMAAERSAAAATGARADAVDWKDLMSILSNFQDKWAFVDSVYRVMSMAFSVFDECRWGAADDKEFVDQVRKLAGDLRTAIVAACDEFDASLGARAEQPPTTTDGTTTAATTGVRAGKAISKSNMDKLRKVRACIDDGRSVLDGMISDDEEEDEVQSNAAPASTTDAPSPAATTPAAAPDHAAEVAALRAEMEGLRARHANELEAAARAAEATLAAKAAEGAEALARSEQALVAARTALKESDAKRSAAEREVALLKEARPAPRSAGDAGAAAAATGTTGTTGEGKATGAKRAAPEPVLAVDLGLARFAGRRSPSTGNDKPRG